MALGGAIKRGKSKFETLPGTKSLLAAGSVPKRAPNRLDQVLTGTFESQIAFRGPSIVIR